jgi:hypothetical protein
MLQEMKILKTIDFKSGDRVAVELPRVHPFSKLQLRLKGQTTSAGGMGGAITPDSPATILKGVDFEVVGGSRSQTIKSLSGLDILKTAQFLFGIQENVNNLVDAPASYSFFGSYDLNFKMPDLKDLAVDAAGRVYDPSLVTLFDPTMFDPVRIVVSWGTLSDLWTGAAPGTLVLDNASIEVVSLDLPELSGLGNKFSFNREQYKETTFTGADSDLRIDLPKGNRIRTIWVCGIDNGVYSNSIINKVRVVVNENITKVDVGFNQLRNEAQKKMELDFANMPDGVAPVFFDEGRDLQGLLDLSRVDSVRLSADVNAPAGTGKIRLIVQEYTAA